MKDFNIPNFLASLLLTMAFLPATIAQTDKTAQPSWRKAYKEGSAAYTSKAYNKAATLLKVAADLKPSHLPTLYQAGMACYANRDYTAAKKFFLDVKNDKKAATKYPNTAYYYGLSLKSLGEYDAAMKAFDDFVAQITLNHPYYSSALSHIAGCSYALNVAPRNTIAKIENMGMGINTPDSELGASNLNANKMFFTTANENATSLKMVDNVKMKATAISMDKENLLIGAFTLASDGKTCYFDAIDKTAVKKRRKIYTAELVGDKLMNTKACDEGINGTATDTFTVRDPFLGVNDRGQAVLYTASNRTGTRGGMDLWSSIRRPNGDWWPSRNLGDQINSSSDEISPFIDKTQKLYYSTNRPETMGGFDVYSSVGFGRYWRKPNNMGLGINSPADDYGFSTDIEGKNSVVSSNRKGSQTLNFQGATNDLYASAVPVVLPPAKNPMNDLSKFKVNGSVLDKFTHSELKGFQISLFQVIDGSPVLVDRSNSDSGYDFTLDKDKVYVIEAETEDIRIETFLIDPTDYSDAEVTRDILVAR
jgi:tetratricopeptide (TPR) repeat protein